MERKLYCGQALVATRGWRASSPFFPALLRRFNLLNVESFFSMELYQWVPTRPTHSTNCLCWSQWKIPLPSYIWTPYVSCQSCQGLASHGRHNSIVLGRLVLLPLHAKILPSPVAIVVVNWPVTWLRLLESLSAALRVDLCQDHLVDCITCGDTGVCMHACRPACWPHNLEPDMETNQQSRWFEW